MSRAMAADGDGDGDCERKKYKGVRRRRWGSGCRRSGCRGRGTGCGSGRTPPPRRPRWPTTPPCSSSGARTPPRGSTSRERRGVLLAPGDVGRGQLSPQSVQRVASDAGMAADAGLAVGRAEERELQQQQQHQHQQEQNQQQQLVQQPAVLTGEYWGPAGGDEWWSDYGVGGF
uniref:Uncharacterized protein n=1 Tax=Ananas comosus var. bracteatus TaxID=296719 RepID=A0A6V7QV93_ANACO